MSTEIGHVEGEFERITRTASTATSTPEETSLYVVSFSGGMRRGQCLQLGVDDPHADYIQLDKNGVKKLVKILKSFLKG